MKNLKIIALALICFGATSLTQAQTADEIITNYFENTGGLENWKNIKALKFEGTVDVQGMSLPIEMVQTANGKSLLKADFQGQTFYQNVFDGEVLWGTNQMTMAPEKSDAESTANYKLEMNDFPDSFLNYKEKGYEVELVGTETVEGTETYKIKLVKEPIMVDGKEKQDISFHYFDTENFVPIVVEREISSGPGAGMISQTTMSDYDEVNGLYFPFSITEGLKGQPGGQEIKVSTITIDPEIEDSMFSFPATSVTPSGEKK